MKHNNVVNEENIAARGGNVINGEMIDGYTDLSQLNDSNFKNR